MQVNAFSPVFFGTLSSAPQVTSSVDIDGTLLVEEDWGKYKKDGLSETADFYKRHPNVSLNLNSGVGLTYFEKYIAPILIQIGIPINSVSLNNGLELWVKGPRQASMTWFKALTRNNIDQIWAKQVVDKTQRNKDPEQIIGQAIRTVIREMDFQPLRGIQGGGPFWELKRLGLVLGLFPDPTYCCLEFADNAPKPTIESLKFWANDIASRLQRAIRARDDIKSKWKVSAEVTPEFRNRLECLIHVSIKEETEVQNKTLVQQIGQTIKTAIKLQGFRPLERNGPIWELKDSGLLLQFFPDQTFCYLKFANNTAPDKEMFLSSWAEKIAKQLTWCLRQSDIENGKVIFKEDKKRQRWLIAVSIEGIDKEDVANFYQDKYEPESVALIRAGDAMNDAHLWGSNKQFYFPRIYVVQVGQHSSLTDALEEMWHNRNAWVQVDPGKLATGLNDVYRIIRRSKDFNALRNHSDNRIQ